MGARKAEGLLACGASVRLVASRVGPAARALEGVVWEERPYRAGEAAGYRLVVAATDQPSVNHQVFVDAESAGVWVNSADDPRSCSFILPSVVRQGPVTVAVSTGGRSPALAAWLRAHVAEELGPEYEVLAEMLAGEREAIKAAGGSTGDVDWKSVFRSDMLELLQAGRVDEARERLRACLSSS